MLAARYRTAASPGNLNNLFGFPVALLGIPDDTEWMVAEMGMSTPDELRQMEGLTAKAMNAGAWGMTTGLIYVPYKWLTGKRFPPDGTATCFDAMDWELTPELHDYFLQRDFSSPP